MALTATELDLKKNQKRLDASVMALEALRNVIKNNSGITCATVAFTCHAVYRWAENCVTGQEFDCSCFAIGARCREFQSNSCKVRMIIITKLNLLHETDLPQETPPQHRN